MGSVFGCETVPPQRLLVILLKSFSVVSKLGGSNLNNSLVERIANLSNSELTKPGIIRIMIR